VLLAVAVVVLVLAGVGTVLWFQSRQEGAKTFSSQFALLPFSLSHPESWRPDEDGVNVVVAPDPVAASGVFLDGQTAPWSRISEVLASSPDQAVGVYAFTQLTVPPAGELEGYVEDQLGQNGGVAVNLGDPVSRPVGGVPGYEFEGTLSDPQAPSTQLRALVDVALPSSGSGVALFVLFAPAQDFEAHRETLTAVRDSITFR
jgi:hypothetical protein